MTAIQEQAPASVPLEIVSADQALGDQLDQIQAVVCCLRDLMTTDRRTLDIYNEKSLFGLTLLLDAVDHSLEQAINSI